MTERYADLDDYLRSSSVAIDGEMPHAISGQERITVQGTADQQGAAFVNSYEKVPEDTTHLQAKKVFLDADGNALSLSAGQFSFLAQPCDENGRNAGEGTDATNAANGLVQFDELKDLDPGTYWFLLTEVAGDREDVDYSTERYLAKVEVPEATAGPTINASSTVGTINIAISFGADAGEYRLLEGSASNVYDFADSTTLASAGTATLNLNGCNQKKSYYVAKIGKNAYNNPTVEEILYTIDVDCGYDNGTLKLYGVTWTAGGSGSGASDEPTITYYDFNGETKTEISSVPVFTNRMKNTTVKVTLRGKKVGVDNVALAGAKFTFEDMEEPLISGPDGFFPIGTDLGAGDYYLTEIKAPDGYNLLDHRVKITVSADGTVHAMSDVEGTATSYDVSGPNSDGVITITIPNNPGAELPQTGGPGTAAFTICGAALIAAGACMFLLRPVRRQ